MDRPPNWPGSLQRRRPQPTPRLQGVAQLLNPRREPGGRAGRGPVAGNGRGRAGRQRLDAAGARACAWRKLLSLVDGLPYGVRRWRAGRVDAVIGNPPWDRIQLTGGGVVCRARPEDCRPTRAADRKAQIAALQQQQSPVGQLPAGRGAPTDAQVLGNGRRAQATSAARRGRREPVQPVCRARAKRHPPAGPGGPGHAQRHCGRRGRGGVLSLHLGQRAAGRTVRLREPQGSVPRRGFALQVLRVAVRQP